jgi:hypothetical protein
VFLLLFPPKKFLACTFSGLKFGFDFLLLANHIKTVLLQLIGGGGHSLGEGFGTS